MCWERGIGEGGIILLAEQIQIVLSRELWISRAAIVSDGGLTGGGSVMWGWADPGGPGPGCGPDDRRLHRQQGSHRRTPTAGRAAAQRE